MAPRDSRWQRLRSASGWVSLGSALVLGVPAVSRAEEPPQLSCFEAARQGGLVSDTTASQLCQGASSEAPARCFLRVQHQSFLDEPQSLQLCQYASPRDDPASCYLRTKAQTFLDEARIVQLCQPPVTQLLQHFPYGP
ncbi:hypothetical protein KRR26_24125 [Corallococcus sp. M34]|uniref:hypothetical protein n=1 Tax=Citreicoccus inhibens TaxID=2849499 RepID=UPI001C21DBB2|nr:hypothetical protein [Citreicoccus inhibens]MBU8898704.1 hypothetical protein [Citreicoccus inhibens]